MVPLLWLLCAIIARVSALHVHAVSSEARGRDPALVPFHWPFPFPNPFARIDLDSTQIQRLENDADMAYYADMWVGGQKIKALLDSGSFEFIVFGKECLHCGNTLYDHSKSKGANVSNFAASQSYGSGTTYSVLAFDKLSVGGVNVPAQQFWEVVGADMRQLARGAFQSILGLGPPATAVKFAEAARAEIHQQVKELESRGETLSQENKEIVQNYDDMVDIQKKTVGVVQNLGFENLSFCFGRQAGSAGYVFWNDHAPRDDPEKFVTVDVVGDSFWSAEMSAVKLGERVDIGCSNGNCSAIFDTGTSLIAAPSAAVDKVWAVAREWEASGGSCDDLSAMPDLTFDLNGQMFSLPPESYMGWSRGALSNDVQKYMPQLHDKQIKLRKALINSRTVERSLNPDDGNGDSDAWDLDDGSSYLDDDYDFESTSFEDPLTAVCSPLLMYNNVNSSFGQVWILGIPFFRTYYTSFHFSHKASDGPEAASMSFSAADSGCRPSGAPGAQQTRAFDGRGFLERRPATLHVHARRLQVPGLRNTSLAGPMQIASSSKDTVKRYIPAAKK